MWTEDNIDTTLFASLISLIAHYTPVLELDLHIFGECINFWINSQVPLTYSPMLHDITYTIVVTEAINISEGWFIIHYG